MEKAALKKEIFESAVKAQAGIVQDFQFRIEELKTSDKESVNDQHDSGEQSMHSEVDERIAMLTDQLQMVKDELEKLNRIDPSLIHDVVHLGSVVVTNVERFFVSVSIERFKVGEVDYFGVSTLAPIYKALEGKKVGDSVDLNGNHFEIQELF